MTKIAIFFITIFLSCFSGNMMAVECQEPIMGKLIDAEGNPLEGAYIFVIDDMTNQNIIASTYSDEKGVFSLLKFRI